MNKAIKNFNLSLDYAKHDSVDLAIIQLRSVISQHPKMIKAYQLLALLYIKEQEYSKAGKVLEESSGTRQGQYLLPELRKGDPRQDQPPEQAGNLRGAADGAAGGG